jgi:hypothetical protein
MLHDHYIAASVDWKEEMDQQAAASQIASEEVVVDDDEGVPYDDDAAGTSVAYSTSEDEKPNLAFKNPWELPLLCPSTEQLEQLLHESLSIEARHLPKLYRKAVHEHRAAFHKAVAESPADYCWIDTDSLLLKDTVWKEYISETFSTTQRLSAA